MFGRKQRRIDALTEERDSYRLALVSINERVKRIRNDDEFADQAEQSLTEIENILNITLVNVYDKP